MKGRKGEGAKRAARHVGAARGDAARGDAARGDAARGDAARGDAASMADDPADQETMIDIRARNNPLSGAAPGGGASPMGGSDQPDPEDARTPTALDARPGGADPEDFRTPLRAPRRGRIGAVATPPTDRTSLPRISGAEPEDQETVIDGPERLAGADGGSDGHRPAVPVDGDFSDTDSSRVATSSAADAVVVGDDADPEEMETVMFGQRGLFHADEVRKASARAGASRKGSGSRSTLRADGGRSRRRRPSPPPAVDSAAPPRPPEPDGQATVVMTREEKADVHRSATTTGAETSKNNGDGAAEDEVSEVTGETTGAVRRRVAERAPEGNSGPFRVRAKCDCRMCGRKVTWPRKRRWRGLVKSKSGFRCDTCGNVYCAAHVDRVSGFFESLFYHGRFRCQMCIAGYKKRKR